MNLIDYGRIILRRGWIIVLLAILTAVSAYVISRGQTPVYRSTQLVLIQPARTDLGLTEALIRLMQSYRVYLSSTDRAQEIIDTLDLDMTPDDLLAAATFNADRDRLTMQIDVDLTDGELANDIAREWGNLLVAYRARENQTVRQEDRITALLVDRPQYGLIRPNVMINTIAGGLIGFGLGAILIFALEYLESAIVRRRDDIERSLGLPVLSTIPE
ncbi:MAG: hypothetical protein IAE80_05065 [Anaerolinea sp.]|nr:hypothetical protein [Anaerolinea sp.]